jgi:transposase
MQNLKNTIIDFTSERAEYQLVLPINLGTLIPEDDSVRLLSQVVEELDLKDLILAYSPKGRNPVVPPRIMLKILIYAYMNGIYSSREIELRCRRDINFMWLLEGHRAPDHNTIARFRTGRLKNIFESIFNQFVEKLQECGELPFENVFIDGTKMEANANKYSFVWKKTTEKLDSRLPEKVATLYRRINKEYGTEFCLGENEELMSTLRKAMMFLADKKEQDRVVFVGGKGKRKTVLQSLTEEALGLIEKKEKYMDYMSLFDNRNSFSKTDHDATFMHMKEDHMRNSQLKPGYNLQIAIENGYAVGIDISSERSDMYTLIPLMERLEKNFPTHHFKNIVCDAGYESEENYQYINEHEYISYIKPANYETQKKRSFKKQIGKRENMQYDQDKDEYICAKGRKLKVVGVRTDRRRRSRYPVEVTIYECVNCNRCGYKKHCCNKSQKTKRLYVYKQFTHFREKSYINITSDKGITLRINRSIQAEGAFGMIKEDYNFRRFITRGKANVFIECLVMFFAYNVNKLHNKTIGKGNKEVLYKPKIKAA